MFLGSIVCGGPWCVLRGFNDSIGSSSFMGVLFRSVVYIQIG